MKRLILASCLVAAGLGAVGVGARPALAAGLCVGSHPGCFSTLQAAVNAAHDGDTITVEAGTFAGGVTIDVSVKIVGAGAAATIISGGGSVLTIGEFGASSEPTVSIDGVTITGGVARSSPESTPFTGEEGVFATGGGVEIPPNADFSGGAMVTISNSVISGNRVAPTHTLPFGPPCPGGPCPFALAAGGGIDNWGTLTVANTSVSNNRVGSASGLSTVASDANGGAIMNWLNALTVSNTTISGNEVSATAPNGRFADSGGIFAESGALTMSNSSVTNNSATLAAALPNSVDLLAIAGGIHIGGGASGTTIRNTSVSANSVSMTNTVGDATAFSGGLHTDVDFTLSADVISNNSVSSVALPGSTGNAQGDSGAGEGGGTVSNSRYTGNSVTVSSAAGNANASAGATIFAGTLTNSVVRDNHVHATSPNGSVLLVGGGVQTGGALTLRNTMVSGNTGDANGVTGTAQGGGIFAVDESPNGPPGGPLILTNSIVTHNVLTGGSAITLQGGGIFATNPVTLTHSVIADNSPDQCFGC